MNFQRCRIREFMFYEFGQGHKGAKATKKISCVKGEGAVEQSTLTRCFKIYCLGYINLNDQVKPGRSKNVDSEAVLQDIKFDSSLSELRLKYTQTPN